MKVWNYIRKLISNKASESSKRFIALFITLLVSYITLRYTTDDNFEIVLGELLSFILVLCGEAIWESTRK